MSTEPIYYDPYDYRIDADPHPIWARMRDEAPVYYNDRFDFYALSRFSDVYAASVDHEVFSSAEGTVLELIGSPIEPPPMIFMDPPRHTAFRKMVASVFTPRRMALLEERIHELCRGYLDPFREASTFDYVADFGARLPVMVISSLLGIPRDDQDMVRAWTDAVLHRNEGETGMSSAALAAFGSVHAYFQAQIDERRTRPRDDLMSDLIASELPEGTGPRRLTDAELHVFFNLISSAGNETVARLLGWTALTLAQWPAQRARLVENPNLIPGAVEELLRWEAPSPIQARVLTRNVELHGTTISQGAKVALLTGSAGRDPREFADPDRFDATREISRHVSFGYGIHFCLGASLARIEARTAIAETLERFPEWDVDESAIEMVHTSTVRGPARVPLIL